MRLTAAPSRRSRPGLAGLQSDDRLVRRAKSGDRRAFEAIFERYQEDLYRFCLTLVGGRQDAEDAVQATMVKAIQALPGEERDINLRPWIYRIARNESIDTIRRRRETAALVPDQVAAGPGLVETAEARERLGRLIDDLGELPERQRSALVMRELADLEFAEIGCALDTSPDAVRQAVYEARVSLRQMEAGREMRCDEVVWVISEADGRVVRRRDIRAHLRGCGDCRAFQESIARRRGELRAIAPLPLAASAALVQAALGAGSGGAGGGIAGAAGAGAGKALLGSTVVKTAATCAVVAAIGVTAANRSGLVNVPFGNSGGQAKESAPPSQAPPLPSSAAAKAKRNTTAAETTGGSSSERRTEAGGSTGSRPAGRKGAGEGPSTKANPQQATTASPLETKAHASPGGAKPNKNAAGGGQGHAPGLPSSSAHGQQTATAHKPPQANTSPGTPRGAANDQASPPPPAPPAAEPSPKAEPPAYGKGEESSSRATGKAAPELESSSEIAE